MQVESLRDLLTKITEWPVEILLKKSFVFLSFEEKWALLNSTRHKLFQLQIKTPLYSLEERKVKKE